MFFLAFFLFVSICLYVSILVSLFYIKFVPRHFYLSKTAIVINVWTLIIDAITIKLLTIDCGNLSIAFYLAYLYEHLVIKSFNFLVRCKPILKTKMKAKDIVLCLSVILYFFYTGLCYAICFYEI